MSYTIDNITTEFHVVDCGGADFDPFILQTNTLNEIYNKVVMCNNKEFYINFKNDNDLGERADYVPVVKNTGGISQMEDLISYFKEDVFNRSI